jgi:hypothetical protein
LRNLLGEIIDTAAATGQIPHRRSDPQRVLRAVADFHEQVGDTSTRALDIDPNHEFPEPPCLEYKTDALVLRAIRTPAELLREGKALHNCLPSYLREAVTGNAILYAGRYDNRPLAVELEPHEGGWRIVQAAGRANSGLPPEAWEQLVKWLITLQPPDRREKAKAESHCRPPHPFDLRDDDIPF